MIPSAPNHTGSKAGAGVRVEAAWDAKVPGFGCQLHVIERLEDAAMRVAFGPTVSPEEGVSKVVKAWMNNPQPKQTNNVIKTSGGWQCCGPCCLSLLSKFLRSLCKS